MNIDNCLCSRSLTWKITKFTITRVRIDGRLEGPLPSSYTPPMQPPTPSWPHNADHQPTPLTSNTDNNIVQIHAPSKKFSCMIDCLIDWLILQFIYLIILREWGWPQSASLYKIFPTLLYNYIVQNSLFANKLFSFDDSEECACP